MSSHSTVLSGLLAFIITYASPFLFLIGMMLLATPPPTTSNLNHTSQEFSLSEAWLLEILAVPCILPVALNGVILVAFTAVLTLMQDHLFVWSVFSPKYEFLICTRSCKTLFLFKCIFVLCRVELSFCNFNGDCWGFCRYLYICAATACTSVGTLLYAIISTYCTFVIKLRLRQLEL